MGNELGREVDQLRRDSVVGSKEWAALERRYAPSSRLSRAQAQRLARDVYASQGCEYNEIAQSLLVALYPEGAREAKLEFSRVFLALTKAFRMRAHLDLSSSVQMMLHEEEGRGGESLAASLDVQEAIGNLASSPFGLLSGDTLGVVLAMSGQLPRDALVCKRFYIICQRILSRMRAPRLRYEVLDSAMDSKLVYHLDCLCSVSASEDRRSILIRRLEGDHRERQAPFAWPVQTQSFCVTSMGFSGLLLSSPQKLMALVREDNSVLPLDVPLMGTLPVVMSDKCVILGPSGWFDGETHHEEVLFPHLTITRQTYHRLSDTVGYLSSFSYRLEFDGKRGHALAEHVRLPFGAPNIILPECQVAIFFAEKDGFLAALNVVHLRTGKTTKRKLRGYLPPSTLSRTLPLGGSRFAVCQTTLHSLLYCVDYSTGICFGVSMTPPVPAYMRGAEVRYLGGGITYVGRNSLFLVDYEGPPLLTSQKMQFSAPVDMSQHALSLMTLDSEAIRRLLKQ